MAEGDAEEALVAAECAVPHSRVTGFGFEPVFNFVQGEALLSLDRVEEAVTVLSETIEEPRPVASSPTPNGTYISRAFAAARRPRSRGGRIVGRQSKA